MVVDTSQCIEPEFYVDLWYPKVFPTQAVVVGLSDVRAADDVRVSYDYERDGWVIEQAKYFAWDGDDEEMSRGWTEAAFLPAWQFEEVHPSLEPKE